MTAHELRKERATIASEARAIVQKAIDEKRDLTQEEDLQVKDVESRLPELDRRIATIERVERLEGIEADSQRSLGRQSAPMDPADNPLNETKHDYSLLRAYRCALGIEKGGLEGEVHREIEIRSKRPAQGFYISWGLVSRSQRPAAEQRTLNAGAAGFLGSTGSGGGSIANILGTELIELLRNKMVSYRMGARVLNDMTGGTFSLPKQTAASTSYWVAEGTAPTASNQTTAQVTWTPKTVGAYVDITRRFILQTNLAAEAFAREDLARQIAIAMDYAGLNGSGAGQQPLGLLQDPNVPTYAIGTNGGAPSWTMAVGLEKLVAQANADFGKLGYVTSNAGRAVMKTTPKVGSTFPIFIWENDRVNEQDRFAPAEGMVNGYRAMATQQIPSNLSKGSSNGSLTAVIYGNWDSMTFAFWSGLDLLVDPYTGSSSGTLRIVAMQDADIQFRYENGFSICNDMNNA